MVLALLCTATAWAGFSPIPGKQYALRENTTGLYLDIQTMGINEPNAGTTTNNISLNKKPCVIYFEAGSEGKYKIKNANGQYIGIGGGGRGWNAVIDATHEWIITAKDGDISQLSIAKDNSNYIGWDNDRTNSPIVASKAMYNNAEGGNTGATRLYFSLVEYIAPTAETGCYTIKTKSGTYLGVKTGASDPTYKFASAENPVNYYITAADNDTYYIEENTRGTYVGYGGEGSWDVTADKTQWKIITADNEGFATICRSTNKEKRLGSDNNTNAGTGIFTNVGPNCNTWYFEGTFKINIPPTSVNDENEYTSGLIYYAGACNKLRFTLTESGDSYGNGAKRLSLATFELYNAKGEKVELSASNFTGNNIANFENMLDGELGTYSNAAYNTSGATDDWFEITLTEELGGAFSFSFVTEGTTMNAKAFEIKTNYTTPYYTFHVNAPQGDVQISYNGEGIKDGDKISMKNYNESLFEATPIEGYIQKFILNNEQRTITLVYEKKYSFSLVDMPDGTTITYNENNVANGLYIDDDFDLAQLNITVAEGYTWEVSKDNTDKLIVIIFKQLVIVENPESVVALIKRIGGENAADKFKFVLDPSMNSRNEVFVIGHDGNKVLIKGTTISAITTGIGWYLQNYAHINIAWNSLNEKTASEAQYADLSSIPVPQTEETRTCDAQYRYYLNYCTFGYSMTSWTWKRWQQEIDWMALHGINMPLQIIGLEEVWRKFLTMKENGNSKYNYSDEEAMAFVPGPAFTAWWGMNNLEGWGGTDVSGWGGVQDDAWYKRQAQLAKQICDRQRELGMQPVLPGFSGMVPSNFQNKTGVTCDAGNWCQFTRPKIVLPSNERFAEIAADYYNCLKEVMGESQYYSIDPFHEGGSINGGTGQQYDDAYKAIYNAMEAAKPGSQWVIQQWQWRDNTYQRRSINAVPKGRLIVLDLFSDGNPEFDKYGNGGG